MGGYGSTRWNWHSKATTVEECRQLDAVRWQREDILTLCSQRLGGWAWHDAYTKETKASIGYHVNTLDPDRPYVRLMYTFPDRDSSVDYRVQLTTTQPHFGGVRWWFACPLLGCSRRVRKLYLPSRATYYGCRNCYHLTYESSQESHKYDGLHRELKLDLATWQYAQRVLKQRL